ncbi:MAG: Hsp20/alpha crystallin family protein [bacterium]|nr:Hsp20/alpha crystallin family protein [bacterium]
MNLIPKKYYLDGFFDNFLTVADESKLKCDIYEKDGNYHIELDVPGFEKKDISIECDKGYLTITAVKNTESGDEDPSKNYIRRERSYGKYQREFYLGDVDYEQVVAEFKDGVLNIMVPKKEEVITKKQIEIQ